MCVRIGKPDSATLCIKKLAMEVCFTSHDRSSPKHVQRYPIHPDLRLAPLATHEFRGPSYNHDSPLSPPAHATQTGASNASVPISAGLSRKAM